MAIHGIVDTIVKGFFFFFLRRNSINVKKRHMHSIMALRERKAKH